MPFRLARGGAYTADLRSIRNQIRENGTLPYIGVILITHPGAPNTNVNLFINEAFQPNSALPPVNASLYAIAFGNIRGIRHFNVGGVGFTLPGDPFPGVGGVAGSYQSLGYNGTLPNISDANLLQAVQDVGAYTGEALIPGGAVATGMTRLIIAANEAIRFGEIESGINGVFGNTTTYAPPWDLVHNWGGHTLGG